MKDGADTAPGDLDAAFYSFELAKLFFMPRYSPDLNPIGRLDARGCRDCR